MAINATAATSPALRPSHERTNPYIAKPEITIESASTALTLASKPNPRKWWNNSPMKVASGP